jgi:hypothetical protein
VIIDLRAPHLGGRRGGDRRRDRGSQRQRDQGASPATPGEAWDASH